MIKNQEALYFTEDTIFKEVLSKRLDICKELIERCAPDIQVGQLKLVETEKEIFVGKDRKVVRFDVLTKDDNRHYNIEMMTYQTNIERYIRYNQAMLDVDLTKGSHTDDLINTLIIVFCTYDPFRLGRPIYSIRSTIDDAENFSYNDGRRAIVVTPKGMDKADEKLLPVIQLLAKQPGNDAFTNNVNEAVKEARKSPETRRAQMNLEVKLNSVRREAEQLGMQKGKQEGKLEGKQMALADVLQFVQNRTSKSYDEIKDDLGISDEDFEQILPLLNK